MTDTIQQKHVADSHAPEGSEPVKHRSWHAPQLQELTMEETAGGAPTLTGETAFQS